MKFENNSLSAVNRGDGTCALSVYAPIYGNEKFRSGNFKDDKLQKINYK